MGSPLCFIIQLYIYVLIARVILSFVTMFKPGWAPPPGLRPILNFVHAITDPPVDALRKVVPQPYGFPLDLSFTVWFIIVVFAQQIVCRSGI
jgi:YggT family protein